MSSFLQSYKEDITEGLHVFTGEKIFLFDNLYPQPINILFKGSSANVLGLIKTHLISISFHLLISFEVKINVQTI